MANKFFSASVEPQGTNDIDNVITIPQQQGKQIVIRNLRVVGGDAAGPGTNLTMVAWAEKGKTTVATTVAANSGQIDLVAETQNTLNGQTYAASDWVLLQLDTRRFQDRLGSWQMMEMQTVNAGAATVIDIDAFINGGDDSETDPANAVTAGNTAYVALAEDAYTELIGAATKIFDGGPGAAIFAGKPSHPVSLHLEAGDATEHSMMVTAEYVDV